MSTRGPLTPRERPAIPPDPVDVTDEQTSPFAEGYPSTDIRSRKFWTKTIAALLVFVGGPSSLWAVGQYTFRKVEQIDKHETRIQVLEDRRVIVDDMHRLGCLLCFDRRGPQTKKCGALCEKHRPWTSEDE